MMSCKLRVSALFLSASVALLGAGCANGASDAYGSGANGNGSASTSGAVILAQFTLFLLVGAGLWYFYRLNPPATAFASADRVFPMFIVDHMPRMMSGLLIAAILAAAMSNLSAALNSLSSTTMIDFYLRLRPETPERTRLAGLCDCLSSAKSGPQPGASARAANYRLPCQHPWC